VKNLAQKLAILESLTREDSQGQAKEGN